MTEYKQTKAFLQELKNFLELLGSSDISDIEWEDKEFGLKISRRLSKSSSLQVTQTNGKNPLISKSIEIFSTAVGTFQFGGEKPVVGREVFLGQALGYIKSINVEHPIEVEKPGKIVEIHVEDGQPVEFGQLLFTLVDSSVP